MSEAVLIFRKVAGHPVEDDADVGPMARVDEYLEVIRRTEPARWGKEPEHLVSPRSREWMFHHRQQLDVREPHLLDVRDQPVRHLAGVHKATARPGHARAAAQMPRTERHRLRQPTVAAGSRRHPPIVLPVVLRNISNHRRRMRRRLQCKPDRIALLEKYAL